MVVSSTVLCGEREQAKNVYKSLTGNTPNKAQADYFEQKFKEGKVNEAAREIVEGGHGFYNVTLKNFFTPMTNEDGTTFAPLNDMSATMIGATRDEIDFFRIFWDDIVYQFDGTLITNQSVANGSVPSNLTVYDIETQSTRSVHSLKVTNDWLYLDTLGITVPVYNRTKNKNYAMAEAQNIPLNNTTHLIRTTQQTYTTIEPAAIAGIFSTRAFAAAYYIAGTNRAAFSYFAKNFLCMDMEELRDTTRPDYRVRRDVDRTPGGESATYQTYCKGCHNGMDAFTGALAYYDYVDGAMVYASHDTVDQNGNAIVVGPVAPKYNRNNLFPDGKITTSDSWINLWNEGQNAAVGWGPELSGNGAKSLGKMLSKTQKVRTCLSTKAFEAVCNRKPTSDADKAAVSAMASKFDQDGNFKEVFINAAIACMGN